MQEIFNLVHQRIEALSDLDDLCERFNRKTPTSKETDKGATKKEVISYIASLRREEKLRISRENEFIEFIFTIRGYDKAQLMYL